MRVNRQKQGEVNVKHGRPRDPQLERARERAEQKEREARRSKLHYFGLAGGRRQGQ